MTALRVGELAGDSGEHFRDLFAETDEDGDGHDRDEGKNKSILHQGLAFFALITAYAFRRDGGKLHFHFHS